MASFSLDELTAAFENFTATSDRCAAIADYNAFADLFTEDCTYVEHLFGEMHGREAVRDWIVPLMRDPINAEMRYSHDWVVYDVERGRIIFCPRTHMTDPGDGSDHSTTNWTRLDYAGNGLFSREEDIYNPALFGTMIGAWQQAKAGAATR